jgi:1,6-anhydro-N-acetylmuramate kinase
MNATPEAEYSLGLGMMSGTSCDGLDLAFCRFEGQKARIEFFRSVEYPKEFQTQLSIWKKRKLP